MKKMAVILSGCGYLDGAEINESVFTLLALSKEGLQSSCFAPNREQHHVINHYSVNEEEMDTKRNILIESARIARGDIKDLKLLKSEDFDALIIPGGFGVAKNLSNFAFEGPKGEIDEDFNKVLKDFHENKKPIGVMCISPAVINLSIQSKVTIGSHEETIHAIEKMKGIHEVKSVNSICFDEKNLIVSAPAYMETGSMFEIYEGIEKLVQKIKELLN